MAAALPWKEILKGATIAVSLTRDLMKARAAKPAQVTGEPSDPRAQLSALAQRVEALEATDAEQARVMKMLAEEMQGLARRAAIGYWIGVGGLVVAVAAIVIVLVR
jgi:hypothetical protein